MLRSSKLLLLIISTPLSLQCVEFSIGLTYGANSGSTKDELLFTTSFGYPVKTSQGTFTPEINLLYNANPGLLGNNGHIQTKVDIKLPSNTNAGTLIIKELLFKQINETIDYNPEKNKRLKQQILLRKQLFELSKIKLEKEKTDHNKELDDLFYQNHKLLEQIIKEENDFS